MAHFHVFGDRPALYQWDLNRRVVVNCDCQEVHFSNSLDGEALVVETYTEDGTLYANIPNILLQSALPLNVYAYVCGDERYTQRAALLEVNPRSKPADYVYTETEVKNYEALAARIKKLEENSGSGTVKSVNGNTPDENGNVEIAPLLVLTVTADENGNLISDYGIVDVRNTIQNGGTVVMYNAGIIYQLVSTAGLFRSAVRKVGNCISWTECRLRGNVVMSAEIVCEYVTPENVNTIVEATKYNINTYAVTINNFTLKTGAEITIIPKETITGSSIFLLVNDISRQIVVSSLLNVAKPAGKSVNEGLTNTGSTTYLYAGYPTKLMYNGAYWVVQNACNPSSTELLSIGVYGKDSFVSTAADEPVKETNLSYVSHGQILSLRFGNGNTAEYPKIKYSVYTKDILDEFDNPIQTLTIPAGAVRHFILSSAGFRML